MGVESIIFGFIVFCIVGIALFFVLNFFSSSGLQQKMPEGQIIGFIKTYNGKDLGGIKITLAKVKSDTKFSYIPVKGNDGNIVYTYTDGDGAFKIARAPEGKYWLVIEKSGYKKMLRMLTVNAGKITEITDVTLK